MNQMVKWFAALAVMVAALLVGQEFAMAAEAANRRVGNTQTGYDWGALNCDTSVSTVRRMPVRMARAPVAPRILPMVVAQPAPPPSVDAKCAELFYPTGSRSTSAIHLTKCAPSEIQIGAAFDYVITVTNITDQALRNVIVTDELAKGFSLTSVNPAATSQDEKAIRWALGDLPARQSAKITVNGKATATGELANCVTVTYELPVCLTIVATNPKLKLVKEAPAEVLKCDPVPVKLTVTNTGVGPARDVKIVDTLPDGLVTVDGKREVTFNAGVLGQGESRNFMINAKATKTGRFVNNAVVTGRGGLRDDASSTTVVTQPVLVVAKSGPKMRYLGRPIKYSITVTNKGDGPAKDTVLEDPIPAGTRWLKASDGGVLNGGRVVWQLGTLAPNQSKQVDVIVSGIRIGDVRNVVTARAYCAESVDATAVTRVEGIPAILLEVIDIDDPVEKGAETTYEITVTNQGSTDGTNITIKCQLEEQMAFVNGSGATAVSADGRSITMVPLPRLAPKARAKWQVRIKAVGTGDIRFHVQMNSDQTGRDVQETESTHLYE